MCARVSVSDAVGDGDGVGDVMVMTYVWYSYGLSRVVSRAPC